MFTCDLIVGRTAFKWGLATEAVPAAQLTATDLALVVTRHTPEGVWFKRYAQAYGFQAAVEWRDSGRPLPEPGPGNSGNAFMSPPAKGSRSKWSSNITGKRANPAKRKQSRS